MTPVILYPPSPFISNTVSTPPNQYQCPFAKHSKNNTSSLCTEKF